MNVQNVGRALLAIGASFAIAGPAAAQGSPTPGPEHKVLEMDAGTWDATVEVTMAPGAAPMVSQGSETNTMGCGGLCLITDFKSVIGGMPFHGHGTSAWDPVKKKFVGSWTDSMSAGISLGESTYDPTTKKVTGVMEGPEPATGKVTKSRTVVEYKDASTRVMSMFTSGPDGKEVQTMKITYKRKS